MQSLHEQAQEKRDWITVTAEELEAENDATRRCIALEGEQSFYRWFNDDTQVPPFGDRKERTEMIEKRIAFLSTPMDKHEVSVADEANNGEESQKEASS